MSAAVAPSAAGDADLGGGSTTLRSDEAPSVPSPPADPDPAESRARKSQAPLLSDDTKAKLGGGLVYLALGGCVALVASGGAYTAATLDINAALAVNLGVLIPLWVIATCCAGTKSGAAAFIVSALFCAVGVAIPLSAMNWKPALTLQRLDVMEAPVSVATGQPVQPAPLADGDEWCVAPVQQPGLETTRFFAAAHGCCGNAAACEGWSKPLQALEAVSLRDYRPDDVPKAVATLASVAAVCNVSLPNQWTPEFVVLFTDLDAFISGKLLLTGLALAGVSLCWLPIGGCATAVGFVVGKGRR